MSGSIGANRIIRKLVEPTVYRYYEEVLSKFPKFKEYTITGSYNTGLKQDHGDIDLVVWVDGDLKEVKKEFKEFCEQNEYLTSFKAGRNVGKKAQLYGQLVTCQAPIFMGEGNVQIDNIFVSSKEQMEFAKNFLDMDCLKQTLITALVRVEAMYEYDWVEREMELDGMPRCKENQEKEFVLSMTGLSYRLLTFDEDGKEIDRKEIWRSENWEDVEQLLSWVNLNLSYRDMLEEVAEVYCSDDSIRHRKRIIGIMKSMINVGLGEIGTPKGDMKTEGIRRAENALPID